jgi:hypothetical protein
LTHLLAVRSMFVMHGFQSTIFWSSICLAAAMAAACTDKVAAAPAVLALETPAPPNSAEPNVAVSPTGQVYLSWLERGQGETHTLRYSQLASLDGQWSPPVTVVTRDDLFVNWADFPSLLPTRSGRLLAHWLQKSGDAPYAYDVRVAYSTDQGRNWSESVILHDDGLQGEHGFVSLLESPTGDVQAIWLDGRNTVAPNENPEMQLGFTTISEDGAPGPTQLIDTRICDCCQTSAAWAASGPVVVYRDRSTEEIRDTSIVRLVDGVWTAPVVVHADNWRIEGCPVNGPSVAARGSDVVVAWFTGANDHERVNVAFSRDSGASFSAPVQVDNGNPVGRVSVALSETGDARVAWLERAGENDGAEIRLRTIGPDGAGSNAIVVAQTSAARSSGFPRMAAVGEDLVIAWTEASEPSQVRVARVRFGR